MRRGTEEGLDDSEKIINEIVGMDAAYDAYELPDFSKGSLCPVATTKITTQRLVVYIIAFILSKGSSSKRSIKKTQNERYSNFHTIDWLKDKAKDRFRHRWLVEQKKHGFFEKVHAWHDAASGWFCVLLVGMGAGI